MKKTMLALVLGASAGVVASSATAQTNVTVYGVVDMAIVRESGGAAGAATKLTSGVASGSRLGFKGSEELGNGLSAIFLLENGFQGDTGAMGQGGLLFGRQAYVGLRSDAGTLTLGRQYTPQYLAVVAADPFGSGMAGDTKNLMTATGNGTSRMDNSVKLQSAVYGGFSAEAVYGAGEVAGDSAAGRQLGAGLSYVRGPLTVKLAHHHRDNNTATVKNLGSARNTVATAVYDAGFMKAHFAYGADEGVNSALPRNSASPYGVAVTPSTDSRVLLLGATVPFGQHVWLASWIHKDDRTSRNQDATQLALGYRYLLSKRTDLYLAAAHIRNRNGAAYTVGSAIEAGTGNRAVNLGMRHNF